MSEIEPRDLAMISISPPPFRIYLLRHAEALQAAPGQKDFDRPLSDNGYAAAEIVADEAADKGYKPDLVISSTALRCRQTAEAMRRVVTPSTEFRFVDELYNGSPDIYLSLIAAQTDQGSVMLVAHNPVIEMTLAALIGRDALAGALPRGFPTAGLAVVDSTPSGWVLLDFVTK
ncbi:histidine phosphatase family protein [Rhizobium sp. No.120]